MSGQHPTFFPFAFSFSTPLLKAQSLHFRNLKVASSPKHEQRAQAHERRLPMPFPLLSCASVMSSTCPSSPSPCRPSETSASTNPSQYGVAAHNGVQCIMVGAVHYGVQCIMVGAVHYGVQCVMVGAVHYGVAVHTPQPYASYVCCAPLLLPLALCPRATPTLPLPSP